MSATPLTKIKLGFSPLSERIFLFRHGKDEQLALDKREAEHDVMRVLVDMMMYDAPKGASKTISFTNTDSGAMEQYEITVKPVQAQPKTEGKS